MRPPLAPSSFQFPPLRPFVRSSVRSSFLPHSFFRPRAETPPPKPPHARIASGAPARAHEHGPYGGGRRLHCTGSHPCPCHAEERRGEGRTVEWRSHWSGVGWRWRWRWRGRAAASLTHSAASPAQSSAHSTGATIEGKELKKREGADQVLYPSDTCTRTRKVHLCTTIIFVGREQWTRNTVMR